MQRVSVRSLSVTVVCLVASPSVLPEPTSWHTLPAIEQAGADTAHNVLFKDVPTMISTIKISTRLLQWLELRTLLVTHSVIRIATSVNKSMHNTDIICAQLHAA
jgi:hypothetical protein